MIVNLNSRFDHIYLKSRFLLRKEVIQPHLPVRLPCYDFAPVTNLTLNSSLRSWDTGFGYYRLPWRDGRCVQDPGTYSPLHADERLLAIPTSCSRVADCNPNLGKFFGISSSSHFGNPLYFPLYYVCSPECKGHTDLTSTPPSFRLTRAVFLESPPLRAGN